MLIWIKNQLIRTELSPEDHILGGARYQGPQENKMRDLNTTFHSQEHRKDFPLKRCQSQAAACKWNI